jgi:predicted MFS family arabinose efflux permease
MSSRQLKAGYFVLTWLNIYAVAYYFNYLFFHLREDFGFGNRQNLLFAALNGLIYIPASWYGGRLAQRHGYFAALKFGCGGMAVILGVGALATGLAVETMIMGLWTVAVCFTWAPLEALASHGENRTGLARMVGLYNLVWSSGAAVAYFTGGLLLQLLGRASLYWLPALIHLAQFLMVLWLEREARTGGNPKGWTDASANGAPDFAQHHVSEAKAKSFLRMAWLANPFAYIAMNTVVPLIPDLAARFSLSTALAGFTASVWMFARLAAFAVLWRWTAWHYRFGWLLVSYLVMVGSFVVLLLAPSLYVIVVAQIAFGFAVGLLYYSSLFYSMDVGSETQGEHGGYHETLIGLGIFLGPAVGAASGYVAPVIQRLDVAAVSATLVVGLVGLLTIWRRSGHSDSGNAPQFGK